MNFYAFARGFSCSIETLFPPATHELTWAEITEEPVGISGEVIHHAEDFENGPVLTVHDAGEDLYISYRNLRSRIAKERVISVERLDSVSTPTLTQILERVILPIAMLRWTDSIAVHGSAVEIEGTPFVFYGESHAGKSSIAMAMLNRGAKLISDDLCIVENDGTTSSAAPTIRSWGKMDDDRVVVSAPVAPETTKMWHCLTADFAASQSRPIGAFVDLKIGDEFLFEEVSGSKRVTALLNQTFSFTDARAPFEKKRFELAALLARQIPAFSCTIPRTAPSKREPYYDAIWNSLSP